MTWKRPLDSFVLDAYVGLTAGIVAVLLSEIRLYRGLSLLFLPLAVLTVTGFLRGRAPQRLAITTALVGGFAMLAPLLVIRAVVAVVTPLALSAAVVVWPAARVVDRIYHPLVNRPMPALALETFAGAPIDPASWKGHVVLLDFWATWCDPCRQELPSLAALERQYGGDGRVIVLAADVNAGMDDNADKARAYLQEHEPELRGALWTGNSDSFYKLRSLYNTGIPLLLVVDKSGRVRFIEIGFDARHFYQEVSNTVDDLLREQE